MSYNKINEDLGRESTPPFEGENSAATSFTKYNLSELLKEIKKNKDAESLGKFIVEQYGEKHNGDRVFFLSMPRTVVDCIRLAIPIKYK